MDRGQDTHQAGVLVPVPVSSNTFVKDILPVLRDSYIYAKSELSFSYTSAGLINTHLQDKYCAFRTEKQALGYTGEELKESYGFLLLNDESQVKALCEKGLLVGCSTCCMLGDPTKGVYVSKYSDCLDESLFPHGKKGYIAIFRLTLGRVKSVAENYTQSYTQPSAGFDCHVSEQINAVSETTSSFLAYKRTQYYMYELSVCGSPVKQLRHACPFAMVHFCYGKPTTSLNNASCSLERAGIHYHPWRGHLKVGSWSCHVALRSSHGALLPAQLPEILEMDRCMMVSDLKLLIHQNVFETSSSAELVMEGCCCSGVYTVVPVEHEDASLSLLARQLGEKGLALVLQLKDSGFLLILQGTLMPTQGEEAELRCIFVFPESRLLEEAIHDQRSPTLLPLEILQTLPGLSYAQVQAEKHPPDQQVATRCMVEQYLQQYATVTQPVTPVSSQCHLPSIKSLSGWTERRHQDLLSYLSDPEQSSLPVARAVELLGLGKESQYDISDIPAQKQMYTDITTEHQEHQQQGSQMCKDHAEAAGRKTVKQTPKHVGFQEEIFTRREQQGNVIDSTSKMAKVGNAEPYSNTPQMSPDSVNTPRRSGRLSTRNSRRSKRVRKRFNHNQPCDNEEVHPPRRAVYSYGLKPIITDSGRVFVPHGSKYGISTAQLLDVNPSVSDTQCDITAGERMSELHSTNTVDTQLAVSEASERQPSPDSPHIPADTHTAKEAPVETHTCESISKWSATSRRQKRKKSHCGPTVSEPVSVAPQDKRIRNERNDSNSSLTTTLKHDDVSSLSVNHEVTDQVQISDQTNQSPLRPKPDSSTCVTEFQNIIKPLKKQLRHRMLEHVEDNGRLNVNSSLSHSTERVTQACVQRHKAAASVGWEGDNGGISFESQTQDALTLLADLALGASGDKLQANLEPVVSAKLAAGGRSCDGDDTSMARSVLHTLLRHPRHKSRSSEQTQPSRSPCPEGLVVTGELVLDILKEHSYSLPASCLILGLSGMLCQDQQAARLADRDHGDHSQSRVSDPPCQAEMSRKEPAQSNSDQPVRRKRRLARSRQIVHEGESIRVTRLWKETYEFHLDSKYTDDPLDKSVIRALHGTWDSSIKDTFQEVQLIVHMWIGLFYSKSTTRYFQTEADGEILQGPSPVQVVPEVEMSAPLSPQSEILDLKEERKKYELLKDHTEVDLDPYSKQNYLVMDLSTPKKDGLDVPSVGEEMDELTSCSLVQSASPSPSGLMEYRSLIESKASENIEHCDRYLGKPEMEVNLALESEEPNEPCDLPANMVVSTEKDLDYHNEDVLQRDTESTDALREGGHTGETNVQTSNYFLPFTDKTRACIQDKTVPEAVHLDNIETNAIVYDKYFPEESRFENTTKANGDTLHHMCSDEPSSSCGQMSNNALDFSGNDLSSENTLHEQRSIDHNNDMGICNNGPSKETQDALSQHSGFEYVSGSGTLCEDYGALVFEKDLEYVSKSDDGQNPIQECSASSGTERSWIDSDISNYVPWTSDSMCNTGEHRRSSQHFTTRCKSYSESKYPQTELSGHLATPNREHKATESCHSHVVGENVSWKETCHKFSFEKDHSNEMNTKSVSLHNSLHISEGMSGNIYSDTWSNRACRSSESIDVSFSSVSPDYIFQRENRRLASRETINKQKYSLTQDDEYENQNFLNDHAVEESSSYNDTDYAPSAKLQKECYGDKYVFSDFLNRKRKNDESVEYENFAYCQVKHHSITDESLRSDSKRYVTDPLNISCSESRLFNQSFVRVKEEEAHSSQLQSSSLVAVLDHRGNRRTFENFPVNHMQTRSVRLVRKTNTSCNPLHSWFNKWQEQHRSQCDVLESMLDLEYLIFSEKINQILKKSCKKQNSSTSSRYAWRKHPVAGSEYVSPHAVPPGSSTSCMVEVNRNADRLHASPLDSLRFSQRTDTELYKSSFNNMMNVTCPGKNTSTHTWIPRMEKRSQSWEPDGQVNIFDKMQEDEQNKVNLFNRRSSKARFRFYILTTSEDDFFQLTEEMLISEGHVKVEPHQFDLQAKSESSFSELLIIVRNEDIAKYISTVPHLLNLKMTQFVRFAGVDQPDDVLNLTHQELFSKGGFVVCDTMVAESLTLGETKKLVQLLANLSRKAKWTWFVHCRDGRLLRDKCRFNCDARSKKCFLECCEDVGVVEPLPYHECDRVSTEKPNYLSCMLQLQVQHANARFAVFITDVPDHSFGPHGILAMDLNMFLQIS